MASNFALHSLGWAAFQDLCGTVLDCVLGGMVQRFSHARDGGRDGSIQGVWAGKGSGKIVIQCKHSSRDRALKQSDWADEVRKAKRLSDDGLCDDYILMTNMRVSAVTDEQVVGEFKKAVPKLREVAVYGYEWLVDKIRSESKLRMRVPRLYGLGDLSDIIDERAYEQARAILVAFEDDVAKFVRTEAYLKSVEAIERHKMVVLLGAPATGKSVIATALAVGSFDRWQCSPLKIVGPQDFVRHWNPDGSQFFWVDDAFGYTQYERDMANAWNSILAHIASALRGQTRLVLTSRDYIWRQALHDLKVSALPLLENSQVVIDVERLTESERQKMLYNHIKLGDQDRAFKRRIKTWLPAIARDVRFLPETARRLGAKAFTASLRIASEGISDFVQNPARYLQETLQNLELGHRCALYLLFMERGFLMSPIKLSRANMRVLELLGCDRRLIAPGLRVMDGTFVRRGQREEQMGWVFRHPSIADAIADVVARDVDLVEVFVSGSRPEGLMREAVCGDVAVQGAKIRISRSQLELVVERLSGVVGTSEFATFLAERCDDWFLIRFLEINEAIINECVGQMRWGSFAHAYLSARLMKSNVLSHEQRSAFIDVIVERANHGSVDFLTNADLSDSLEPGERKRVLEAFAICISEQRIDSAIERWCEGVSGDDALGNLEQAKRDVKALRQEAMSLGVNLDADEAVESIEMEMKRIRDAVDDAPEDDYEGEDSYDGGAQGSSIFDDVDE